MVDFSYLKNKHSTTPPTLAAPASVAAQQLAPKQTRSYASASLPSSQKPTQQQQAPAKKYDFFENEDFGDILKTPRMPAWNPDPFVKSATPPPVQRMQQNHNAVDSNFNQVSQQNIVNKPMVNGGPQDITNPFPFSRSSIQKSGNVRSAVSLLLCFCFDVATSMIMLTLLFVLMMVIMKTVIMIFIMISTWLP